MVLLGIVTTILIGWVLHVSAGILQPLVIALLLAVMLQPVVRALARVHIPPPVTVILIVTLMAFGAARVGVLIEANVRALFRLGQVTSRTELRRQALSSPEVRVPEDGGAGEEESAPPAAEPGESGEAGEDGGDAATQEGEELDGSDAAEAEIQDPLPAGIDPAEVDPLSQDQAQLAQRFDWQVLVEGFHDWMLEHRFPSLFADYVHRTLQEANVEGLATGFIGGGLDFSKNLMLVVLYMLFIFAEQAVFRRKILSIFEERQDDARAVLDTIGRGIQRYLGVKTITSFVTGALCYTALVLLHVPYALLLGFATFALNYIPTFGSIIAGVIATVIALVDADGMGTPALVAGTYLTVNLTLGSYVEPKILGRELNLSPLVVIISVVVWAGIWGPVGTFLAVPLTAAMQIILASNESTRPIAVMLSSGPPRERRWRGRRSSEPAA